MSLIARRRTHVRTKERIADRSLIKNFEKKDNFYHCGTWYLYAYSDAKISYSQFKLKINRPVISTLFYNLQNVCDTAIFKLTKSVGELRKLLTSKKRYYYFSRLRDNVNFYNF